MTASDDAAAWRAAAAAALARKTKPLGALGHLETAAETLAGVQRTLTPVIDPARVLVFAGDHGVTEEGVSAYPREVTAQMMANFAGGGAAVTVLARSVGASVEVVDVGVAAVLPPYGHVDAKVREGTHNFTRTAAMSPEECLAAFAAGRAAVQRAHADGCRLIALGEMGIGNSTAAAALLAALLGETAERMVGRGTGVDDAGLRRKQDAVRRALARHEPVVASRDPMALVAALGGFEIAAMAGATLEAAALRLPVLVDGFITTAAVLVAVRVDPTVRDGLLFAHRSAEAGHAVALAALGAEPLLDLQLRLGEGTGAALAVPLLRAACAILAEMATFDSAGVSERT